MSSISLIAIGLLKLSVSYEWVEAVCAFWETGSFHPSCQIYV